MRYAYFGGKEIVRASKRLSLKKQLTYGKKFIVCNGETLETEAPEYDMCNMFECEDRGFVESVISGEKNRNNITNVIETAKLLDALYVSSDRKAEVTLD